MERSQLLFGAGMLLAAAGLLFVLKDRRKKGRSMVLSREKYFARRTLSSDDIARTNKSGSDTSTFTPTATFHPDGPNVGYVSGSSWMDQELLPTKVDKLNETLGRGKLVVVMVGFPGMGKTNIAMKIARYLRWINFRTRVFSIAKYRLDKLGHKTADFFNPENEAAYRQRLVILKETMTDALRYLALGGNVVIIDGTNTTLTRRKLIKAMVEEQKYRLLWVESKMSSQFMSGGSGNEGAGTKGEKTVTVPRPVSPKSATPAELAMISAPHDGGGERLLDEMKNSPDYLDQKDFEIRLGYYRKHYEALTEGEGSAITIFGKNLHLHAIHGFIPTKIVSFVMNLHNEQRVIYMCRHGESEFNARGLIGGDSGLSPRGVEFGVALGAYLQSIYPGGVEADQGKGRKREELTVWSSTMKRARDTCKEIKCGQVVEWRSLRDLEAGVCDGLAYKQIQVMFPEEYKRREMDKLRYRYPRGESYLDVINRLEPVIFELERQKKPVVIIGHQAVLRCLYAYFLDLPDSTLPHLSLPLHTLIKVEPQAHGCREKRFNFVLEGDEELAHRRRSISGAAMSFDMA